MPIYEYECATHGAFDAVRPMAAYREPLPCPECGATAARVILSSVALACTPSAVRTARQRNERSAHEPQSTRDSKHGKGCACCSGSSIKSATKIANNGTKMFPAKRPWMISH